MRYGTIAVMVEPTDDQGRVLALIYNEFQRTGRRPTYQWIDKLIDGEGLSMRYLVTTMPPNLMTPDTTWGGHYWRKEDELLVTVKGLLYCGDEARRDLDLLARVLRYFADRERIFMPSASHQVEELVMSSQDLQRDLSLSDIEIQKVFVLLEQFESRLRFGSGGSETDWSWTLECEQIRHYRDVEDATSYLLARGDLPEPEPTSAWARARRLIERVGLRLRGGAERARQRTPEVVSNFIRHPLVIGVAAAVVSTLLTLYLR
jgi:hypothetical protein